MKRTNKAAAIAAFTFFLILTMGYMCGLPVVERSPDNALVYCIATVAAVFAFFAALS